MEHELDLATEHTTVIPVELENFVKTLDNLQEVILYFSSELFNPDEYYIAQGLDTLIE
jgi:hypothetical protein